jgi:hypothetical protein
MVLNIYLKNSYVMSKYNYLKTFTFTITLNFLISLVLKHEQIIISFNLKIHI